MENFIETKYSEYKDSGVEWLGVIPSSWDLTRLGTRFEERKTKVIDLPSYFEEPFFETKKLVYVPM